jgi:hypothetical protein
VADVTGLCAQLAVELAGRGATAVALTGSRARGDATATSDLDLIVVGDGPEYRLEVRDGILVSQMWASEEVHRARLRSPGEAAWSVPGWREAVILYDARGAASALKDDALDWSWDQLRPGADEWVAEQLAGFAEEVHKLVAALDQRRPLAAAVQRNVLALRMAPILAVHHRLLYGSENRLWERVGELMDAEWRETQASALALGGERLEISCAAALRLFRLACACAEGLLDDGRAAVVRHALATAAPHDPDGR